MTIAAIMTCHDRKEKTLACLRSFFVICPDADVYLTDDGCTDGTAEAVVTEFPKVNIVKGDGNLYWSRGMFTAWKEAVKEDYDFYLWLNDDVELYADVIGELTECSRAAGGDNIVSGLVESFDKKTILYGGSDASKHLIGCADAPQDITFMNGNVVLVSKSVVDRIGIIDPVLHHDLGDVDYGLTARENGVRVVSTRKPVAAGYPNNYCRVRKWGTSLANRLKRLNHPLGSPISTNYYFRRKHFGTLHALLFCSRLIILNLLPDFAVSKIWGDIYKDK